MTADELQAVMDSVGIVMREAIATATGPLLVKIATLETQLSTKALEFEGQSARLDGLVKAAVFDAVAQIPVPKDGQDGKPGERGERGEPGRDGLAGASVTVADLQPLIAAELASALASVPPPKDGRDGVNVTPADVQPVIAAEVARQVAMLPVPKDGQDGRGLTPADVAPLIESEVASAIKALPPPKDGTDGVSVTVADVQPLIASEVARAVNALPIPKNGQDGRSVTPADVAPLIVAEVTKAIASIPSPTNGRDGRDAPSLEELTVVIDAHVEKSIGRLVVPKSALIDSDGHLLLSFTDGSTKDIGRVMGKDGTPGIPGRDGLPGSKGERGIDGRDGLDGLGLDDAVVEYDGERGFVFKFSRGSRVKEFGKFEIPCLISRGSWQEGRLYDKGDGVVRNGSFWEATAPTSEKPGNGATAWRLIAKCGADGRSGARGEKGEPGRDHPLWFDRTT